MGPRIQINAFTQDTDNRSRPDIPALTPSRPQWLDRAAEAFLKLFLKN